MSRNSSISPELSVSPSSASMSNTDILRTTEGDLLPPDYERNRVFELLIGTYQGRAEVDGFHPGTKEAIEICQSESSGSSPKPGQKRKLASDVLKLILLRDLGYISRGRVFVTSREMYTWCQQTGSWLNAARKQYDISVELRVHDNKKTRKKVRNALAAARREMQRAEEQKRDL